MVGKAVVGPVAQDRRRDEQGVQGVALRLNDAFRPTGGAGCKHDIDVGIGRYGQAKIFGRSRRCDPIDIDPTAVADQLRCHRSMLSVCQVTCGSAALKMAAERAAGCLGSSGT